MSSGTLATFTKKWEGLLGLLKVQLLGAPAPTVESTRQQLRRVYEQAVQRNLTLTRPDFQDPVFEGMHLESVAKAAILNFATEDAKEADRRRRNKMAVKKFLDKLRAAAIAAGCNIKRRAPYTLHPGPNPCHCGCGTMVRRRWASGHHLLWMGWMKQVERGQWTISRLPEFVQKNTVWVRCTNCKGLIPTRGHDGRLLVPRLGYSCRAWLKRLRTSGVVDPNIVAAVERDLYLREKKRERQKHMRQQMQRILKEQARKGNVKKEIMEETTCAN
jgi:hypothetical protein